MEMDHNILVQLVLLSQVLILLLFFKVVLRLENQAITKPTIWNDKIFAVNSRYDYQLNSLILHSEDELKCRV